MDPEFVFESQTEKILLVKEAVNSLRKDLKRTKRQVEFFEYNHIGLYMQLYEDWGHIAETFKCHQAQIDCCRGALAGLLGTAPNLPGNAASDSQPSLSQLSRDLQGALRLKEESQGKELNLVINRILRALQTGETPHESMAPRGLDAALLAQVYSAIQHLTAEKNTLKQELQETKTTLKPLKEKKHNWRLRDSQAALKSAVANGLAEIKKGVDTFAQELARPHSPEKAHSGVKSQLSSLRTALFPELATLISSQLNSFSADLSTLQCSIGKVIQQKEEDSFFESLEDFITPATYRGQLSVSNEKHSGKLAHSQMTANGSVIEGYSTQIRTLKESTMTINDRTKAIESELKVEYNKKLTLLKRLQDLSKQYRLHNYPRNSAKYKKLLEYQEMIKQLEDQLNKS